MNGTANVKKPVGLRGERGIWVAMMHRAYQDLFIEGEHEDALAYFRSENFEIDKVLLGRDGGDMPRILGEFGFAGGD